MKRFEATDNSIRLYISKTFLNDGEKRQTNMPHRYSIFLAIGTLFYDYDFQSATINKKTTNEQ